MNDAALPHFGSYGWNCRDDLAEPVDTGQSLYDDGEEEAIHLMFGLTYASYLVLPRVLLQSMPTEWQLTFARLCEQFDRTFDGLERPYSYRVNAVDENGRFARETLPRYNRGRTRVERQPR